MAKKTELTVEQKLRKLYDLQLVESQIDELRNMRGELPLEVEDLEDEVAGLNSRISKFKAELDQVKEEIKTRKNTIEEAKTLIKRYADQQKNVRNNREYNSISKEIEYQELEIQLAEKKIKEYKAQVEHKKEIIAKAEENLAQKEAHLKHKKEELDVILEETRKEEEFLIQKSEEFAQEIEPRLLTAYRRIRSSVVNRLAVVPIERGASGGSFFTIPPQVQMEISARKKIITDEHSGRILIDEALAQEEREKMQVLFEQAQSR